VDIGGPLRFELPAEAAGAQIREGSTKAAAVDGTTVTVSGPFAPGTTVLQLEYTYRFTKNSHTINQAFPVPLQRAIVGVEKVGSVQLASPQFASVTELPTESGVYLLGQGGALQPGTPLTFTLSNLPVHSNTAWYVVLGLSFLVATIGVWLAINPASSAAASRKALVNRRDNLLGELAQLETKRREGTISDRAERRRVRILSELEHIYAELDATAGPRGGGEGIAA
jgi:hypothetical protein